MNDRPLSLSLKLPPAEPSQNANTSSPQSPTTSMYTNPTTATHPPSVYLPQGAGTGIYTPRLAHSSSSHDIRAHAPASPSAPAGTIVRATTAPHQHFYHRGGAESPRAPAKMGVPPDAPSKDLHLDGSEPRFFPGVVSSSQRPKSARGKHRSWSEKDGGGSTLGSDSQQATS